MRSKFVVGIFLISLLMMSVMAQTATIESFASMAGCWERTDKSGTAFSEMWMKPAGNTMMGTGRTVKAGKTVDFEFLRIEQRPDGIFYIAKPKANAEETPFKLKPQVGNEFVFENPEHDFPQRIIYKLNKDSMVARIEGTQNGKLMGIDFPSTRTSCEQK